MSSYMNTFSAKVGTVVAISVERFLSPFSSELFSPVHPLNSGTNSEKGDVKYFSAPIRI